MKIAVLGLGSMGHGIAACLLESGYSVTGWNRTPSPQTDLKNAGATIAASPVTAVENADVIISMLADDSATLGLFGPEASVVGSISPGLTHISMSTISTSATEQLARIHVEAGQQFIAAPVFGGPAIAKSGNLAIVVAGDQMAVEQHQPVLDALGRVVFNVGERASAASSVKLAVNLLLFANLEAIGEAMRLTGSFGVKRQELFDILIGSAFDSPMMRNFGNVIAGQKYDPAAFKIGLAQKDLRLAIEAAREAKVDLAIAGSLQSQFEKAIAKHGYDADVSVLGDE